MQRRLSTRASSSDAELAAALQDALSDLERVRFALDEADRDASDPRNAVHALVAHWRRHEAVYRTVMRQVGEEVREGVLAQLEAWKGELREQLAASEEASLRRREQEIDARIAALQARLVTTEAELDRAELLIELGELHESRHRDTDAEGLFRAAEQELEPHRQRATGSGIADALVAALPGVGRGQTPGLRAALESVARVSQLLQRVYEGLARVSEDTDARQRYIEQGRELRESLAQGSQGNRDFQRRLVEELSRQIGGSTAETTEGDEPET